MLFNQGYSLVETIMNSDDITTEDKLKEIRGVYTIFKDIHSLIGEIEMLFITSRMLDAQTKLNNPIMILDFDHYDDYTRYFLNNESNQSLDKITNYLKKKKVLLLNDLERKFDRLKSYYEKYEFDIDSDDTVYYDIPKYLLEEFDAMNFCLCDYRKIIEDKDFNYMEYYPL